MKHKLLTHLSGLILCSTLFAYAQGAEANECRPSDVAGSYGYTSSGAIVSPAVGPFTAVGRVTFTNAGTFSGEQTTSVAGNLVEETVAGTYTVNPDCTGSAIVYVYHGSTLARTSNLHLVWDLRETEVRAIFLTAGTAISITGRKMFRGDDD